MTMIDKPLVIYHGNCPDGFTAAWCAYDKFDGDCDFVPASYGQEPPDVGGRRVYILDFSYKRPVMRQILSQAHSVVVLDHHKTAQAELDGIIDEFCMRPDLIANPRGSHLPVVWFDMDKSGARLAWEHFSPGEPVPWLVEYVEDRDLWRWALPKSREVNAALGSYPRTFDQWDRLAASGPEVMHRLIGEGEAILRYQDQLVDSICRGAREVEMDGCKILAANTSVLFSEVAGKLSEGRPFGAAWFERADGKTQWSLRSRNDGNDVSEVARRRGGGGHRNAAGFES